MSGEGRPVATAMSQACTAASSAHALAPTHGASGPTGSGVVTSGPSAGTVDQARAAARVADSTRSTGSPARCPDGSKGFSVGQPSPVIVAA